MRAGILDPIPRFVRELAEVHLPWMTGEAQHVDVCPGAKNSTLGAGNEDTTDLGVFEADALQGIVQLNVDPQIVGVQLQFVAWADSAVFLGIHAKGCDGSIKGKLPMTIAGRLGAVVDKVGLCRGFHALAPGESVFDQVQLHLDTNLSGRLKSRIPKGRPSLRRNRQRRNNRKEDYPQKIFHGSPAPLQPETDRAAIC